MRDFDWDVYDLRKIVCGEMEELYESLEDFCEGNKKRMREIIEELMAEDNWVKLRREIQDELERSYPSLYPEKVNGE